MSEFTRLWTGLWNWEPFTELDPTARVLWLALYTTAEAKRIVPGLWHGSITTMAEAARLPVDQTVAALDRLLERDLVEWDHKNRVLRMTELPDAGEYPTSPTIVRSWWKRFRMLPACQVRDAHVATIRWILDRGALESSKNRSGRPTPAHEQEWAETFGTVPIPPPRRRGVRRLAEHVADTSTAVQPSLFAPSRLPVSTPVEGLPTVPEPASPPDVGSDPEIKDLSGLDTLSRGYGEGEGAGAGVGSFSGSGSGAYGGGDQAPARPRLSLVPPTAGPLTPERLVALLAGRTYGATLREGTDRQLRERVVDLERENVVEADLERLAAWLARGYGPLDRIGGDPTTRLSAWASYPGAILRALADLQTRERAVAEHERHAQDRSVMLGESLRALGWAKETSS